jgi:hypothetical protein
LYKPTAATVQVLLTSTNGVFTQRIESRSSVETRMGVGFTWIHGTTRTTAGFLELDGDVSNIPQIRTLLPYTEFYWPPTNVQASRDGDQVMVTWYLVPMSEDDDRGYLIEAWLCQDGQLRFTPLHFWTPPAFLTDEPGCMEPSSARIYTAEKHGYTEWVLIPWPPHPTPEP